MMCFSQDTLVKVKDMQLGDEVRLVLCTTVSQLLVQDSPDPESLFKVCRDQNIEQLEIWADDIGLVAVNELSIDVRLREECDEWIVAVDGYFVLLVKLDDEEIVSQIRDGAKQ